MSEKIVQLNEEVIKGQIKELVRGSVEETLNELLEKEAESLTQAARYERSEARQGYRSGHYDRNLTTTSGDVTLHVPRLKGVSFETAIIERYRRRESSVEEALIEMYLAGVSVRRVEDITEALWGSKVSPATISELNKKASREKAKAVVAELRAMKLKEAAKKIEDGIEETLTYCDFPSEHWTRIRTNNVIERLNRGKYAVASFLSVILMTRESHPQKCVFLTFSGQKWSLYAKIPHFRAEFFRWHLFINATWSCWADLNRRPHPYQGCALPTELQQQIWRRGRDLNPRPPA